ncbi:MAG: AbrB/MazE/SpoVT family DNA-binding domain-containing protein [Chloroflexota bacterium]|nr:MAG: AbrB/MazE/SpoVT family DNA-binding domain-containing protein [Chloroflexota bacterium]
MTLRWTDAYDLRIKAGCETQLVNGGMYTLRVYIGDSEVGMRVAVQKWGNSLAMRIPKALADEARVMQGTEVDVTVQQGRLIAAPVERVPTLEELLAGFGDPGAGRGGDTESGFGNEAWPDDAPSGREALEPWPTDQAERGQSS